MSEGALGKACQEKTNLDNLYFSVSEYGRVFIPLKLSSILSWNTYSIMGPWLYGCIETQKRMLSC